MNTLGERLKHIRGNLSQASFAKQLGIPQTTLSNYEINKAEPSFSFIVELSKKFNTSLEWLLTGEENQKAGNDPKNGFIQIPFVDAILSAGHGSLETSGDFTETLAFQTNWITKKGNPEHMVCMRVSGDSMEPDICHNDAVLIDQSKKDTYASRFYAVGLEDSIYIKRIEKEPNKIILASSNKEYRPIEILMNEYTQDQFRIIGKVLWVGREY